jgi:hypothetical protein
MLGGNCLWFLLCHFALNSPNISLNTRSNISAVQVKNLSDIAWVLYLPSLADTTRILLDRRLGGALFFEYSGQFSYSWHVSP